MERFYVEKYSSEDCYMDGDMSSCKDFNNYDSAKEYFDKMKTKYKRGVLVLSQDDEEGYPTIIIEEEILL